MPSPFEEDLGLTEEAERLGLLMDRRLSVIITDLKALEAAGLVRQVPDYLRIRKLLLDGVEVVGAKLGEYEYVLRRKDPSK